MPNANFETAKTVASEREVPRKFKLGYHRASVACGKSCLDINSLVY